MDLDDLPYIGRKGNGIDSSLTLYMRFLGRTKAFSLAVRTERGNTGLMPMTCCSRMHGPTLISV